jgi:Mg2+/citrate symporter
VWSPSLADAKPETDTSTSLAGIDYGDQQRFTMTCALGSTLVLLAKALVTMVVHMVVPMVGRAA